MSFETWANKTVDRLDWIDIALVKFSCIALGVLLAALIPELIEINPWWILAVVVILAIRPYYRAYVK